MSLPSKIPLPVWFKVNRAEPRMRDEIQRWNQEVRDDREDGEDGEDEDGERKAVELQEAVKLLLEENR